MVKDHQEIIYHQEIIDLKGNNRRPPPIKKEEALGKITATDNVLEPGLVKKYFQSDSLKDFYFETKDYIENENKAVKEIKMLFIKHGLIKLKDHMRNMSEYEIKNRG